MGEEVVHFWDCPELADEGPGEFTADPIQVARLFGVRVKQVLPYLAQRDPDEEFGEKAFPDDEHELGDHWVRTDFMRRIGLKYPNFDEPGGRYFFIEEPDGGYEPPYMREYRVDEDEDADDNEHVEDRAVHQSPDDSKSNQTSGGLLDRIASFFRKK